jgi:hypothetical protein
MDALNVATNGFLSLNASGLITAGTILEITTCGFVYVPVTGVRVTRHIGGRMPNQFLRNGTHRPQWSNY